MNKMLFALMATVAAASAYPAVAADKATYDSEVSIERDEDGNFERVVNEKSTDTAGTTTKREVKSEVKVNADGTADQKVTAEVKRDPKGILNSTSVETTNSIKHDGEKVVHEFKKKVNGEVVEDKKVESER